MGVVGVEDCVADDEQHDPLGLRNFALGAQTVAQRLAKVAVPMAEAAAPLLDAVKHAEPTFQRMVRDLSRTYRTYAPPVLSRFARDTGHVLSPALYRYYPIILATFATDGLDAASRELDAETRRLVLREDWQQETRARWAGYSIQPRRAPLLVEAFDAYRAGMYAVAVPTLVAQTEGVLVDATRYRGISTGPKLRELLARLAEGDPLKSAAHYNFYSEWLLTRFEHGDEIPAFSRHAILHGADVDYAREPVARKALLWLDTVIWLAERYVSRG